MPVTYAYPTDAALTLIERDYMANLDLNDPAFDQFPIETVDDDTLIWEQEDDYVGLMQVRGMNGDPSAVKNVGGKRYQMTPGYYGEFMPIDEMEMTRRRAYGQFNGSVPIGDLVTRRQDQLRERRIARMKWVIWQLITTGTFNVFNQYGALVHSDSFKIQAYTPQVPWTSFGTATPLADYRAMRLLSRGHSVSFGSSAVTLMNQYTNNVLLSNTNANDIGGKRVIGGGTYNALDQVNQLFAGNDLPGVRVHDDGYKSDGTDGNAFGSYQLYIPDGVVVLLGRRPGNAKIGQFRLTRNVNAPDGKGAYAKVFDNGDRAVPRKIEVHSGFNGGPVVAYPSSIVAAKMF